MKTLSFDKLKSNVKKEVRYNLMRNSELLLTLNASLMREGFKPVNGYFSNEISEQCLKSINDIIDRWDIRMFKSLVTLFNYNDLPKWLNNASIGYEDGKWFLYSLD